MIPVYMRKNEESRDAVCGRSEEMMQENRELSMKEICEYFITVEIQ